MISPQQSLNRRDGLNNFVIASCKILQKAMTHTAVCVRDNGSNKILQEAMKNTAVFLILVRSDNDYNKILQEVMKNTAVFF